MAERIKVGVIFGGRSGEHEVSLMSAASVMKALDPEHYEVVPIGITQEGRWLAGPGAYAALGSEAPALPALGGDASRASILPEPGSRALVALEGQATPVPMGSVDVVFPVLHGTYGEDGTIQGLLELADIPYVGAGVCASAAGMDKAVMKTLFRAADLPIADFEALLRSQWERDREGTLDHLIDRFGLPCFVKPVNLGSSVGISKARHRDELARALDFAARYDRKLLVEQFIPCRELECSVLGNDDPVASVVGEVCPSREFYDYRAKYVDGTSELFIPANVPEPISERVRELAVAAFRSIDCAGLARVDFFLTPTGEVYLNEINTMPGFTSISMYPKLWEATGLSYSDLLSRLVDLALERYADKKRSVTTYGELEDAG